MADIQSAALTIGRLLVEEANYLLKVKDQVKELKEEVEWMQCFLRDADASQMKNTMARKWVAQMRDFAYEAEDIIEKFLVRVHRHSRGRGDLYNHAKKYLHLVWEIAAVKQTGSRIDRLKAKISALTTRLKTYGIEFKMGETSSSSWYSNLKSKTYCTYEEEEFVRCPEIVDRLVAKMDDAKTKVCAICGDGGIGKTFLAWKVYKHTEIRRKFKAFAWAYVSEPCQISSIEQQLVRKLGSKTTEQVGQMTEAELKDELHKTLRKIECLVVLDGIWGTGVWDDLVKAFPISNQDFKSRILITTRLEQVAKHVDQTVYIRTLHPLEPEQARRLLEIKVGSLDSFENKEVPDDMVKHCGGNPLAIVVLGGMLSTKNKTKEEWKSVSNNIKPRVNEDNVPWKRILEMCYYELPYQLKVALIYLGYFPANLEIPKRKIMHLWEVEGLVSAGEDDTIADETLQDVAERYLGELVERSLVQVGSRTSSGKAKTCRVHDLIRQDLCISKASEANWLKIVHYGNEKDPSSSSRKSEKMKNRGCRHLAIYCNESLEKLLHDYRHAKSARSILFFNTLKRMDALISVKKQTLSMVFKNHQLLRVLDLENIEVKSLPPEVGFLIHLRYLSLKDSSVSKLPSTMKYLRCLQTLDLRVLAFVQLRIPDVLFKMEQLVHLYLPPQLFVPRCKAEELQLTGLHKLETLVNFRSNKCKEEDVSMLTNLRKFSSSDFLGSEKLIDLFATSTSPLHHLVRLSLRIDGKVLKSHPKILQGLLDRLHQLWLNGQLPELHDALELSEIHDARKLPELQGSPKLPVNLAKLSLCGSKLQCDPMPTLEKLPHLVKLSLEEDSFEGEAMRCSKKGFPKLRYLKLKGLTKFEKWQVEQGAMPKLICLEINHCKGLKKLPEDLQNVKSLKELTLSYMPLSFYQGKFPVNDRDHWPDHCHVRHVPEIHFLHCLDDGINSREKTTLIEEIEKK